MTRHPVNGGQSGCDENEHNWRFGNLNFLIRDVWSRLVIKKCNFSLIFVSETFPSQTAVRTSIFPITLSFSHGLYALHKISPKRKLFLLKTWGKTHRQPIYTTDLKGKHKAKT